MSNHSKPLVLITGAAGSVGTALKAALADHYTVVGCDRPGQDCDIEMDVTSPASIQLALQKLRDAYGGTIAAVAHLAAYFDFSGEPSPLYQQVNVQGLQNLLQALQAFNVERFIFAGTMLVHKPGAVGETIDETAPVEPRWAYPQSKADAEAVIREHHGDIPYTILRLAGLYDDASAVPTLAQQIARIYERDLKSVLYAGDAEAGQAFIHRDDMVALFQQVIARRRQLPAGLELLAGEPQTVGYRRLQQHIGELIHGEREWATLSLPEPLAKAGAWLQEKTEPLVPDDFDQGEQPFIRPFMIDMASDHYALDISKARELLDWQPQRRILDELPKLIESLKEDPAAWYRRHNMPPPNWIAAAAAKDHNPEQIRRRYEAGYRQTHRQFLWAHLLNIGFGFWLMTSPFILGYASPAMTISDLIAGVLVVVLGLMSVSARPRWRWSRWALGAVGLWLLSAPLIFWAPTAAAYLNGTLIGSLVMGFALLARPLPGVSPTASLTGPVVPPGWDFCPSSWTQRLPIIILAFVGFFISRYLAAYQLGHIDAVWEPFFKGALPDAKNGTEEIITSSVSEAWPVSDAGIGGLTYLLEIITGIIGSSKRWRTMPWLVLLFGFMIVPLGAVSITFIIIQPILLDTWCSLCLIAAAAMLLQIPYSFDEIVATIDFLRRRAKDGRPWLLILFTGDTDEGERKISDEETDDFERPAITVIKDMLGGGVSVPWHLGVCLLIGVWLLFTRVTLGAEGGMANADHLIGSLVLTVTVTAFAEVMRPLRFLNLFLGMALLITPFVYGADAVAVAAGIVCGLGLIVFSLPRGAISNGYGGWSRAII